MKNKNINISVIGLGYVGLPLAVSLSKHFKVIGYDKKSERIKELRNSLDTSKEISSKTLENSSLILTNKTKDLRKSNVYMITVPTPIFKNKLPDLSSLIDVSKKIAKILKKNDLIIYESTVYPGCTDELLIPLVEKVSKMKINSDFFVGYSPERIDPGNSKYKLSNQTKLISCSSNKFLNLVEFIYKKVVKNKLHKTQSIKVAEAAKIVENAQRSVNIGFINEISILFHKLNIDTKEVLTAARTKWNFLNFVPGLVGGHCIGVDPYYLKYKALKEGFKLRLISSGAKINDYVSKYIFNEILKLIKLKIKKIKKIKILILGITFKENCNDFRNSKSIELYQLLKNKFKNIDIFDPIVDKKMVLKLNKIRLLKKLDKKNYYDLIIVSVPHKKIKLLGLKFIKSLSKKNSILIDIKSIFPRKKVDWQL
jgi:UDP-N-acetyl-D-galactosamine dehydrogenase